MRVALLSSSVQLGDAIGNNVAEKVAFFRERAAEVRVFVESDRRLHPGVAACCQVVRSTDLSGEWWRYVRSADIVSAEFGQFYSLLSLLPLLAGGKRRVLLDYHGITPPELWGGHNREALIQGLQQRGLAWCADATITHSTFTQDELARLLGLPRQRLPRLGYVVDTSLFSPGAPLQDWRRAVVPDDARVLLFVGRFAPNKRTALLADALFHLADLRPPVHAVLVGDTSDLYQAEAQRCRERARQLGVADRLHVVGPKVGERLRDYYRGAEALVLPSLWESFCIPVVEAMAAGLPVVAARATALPQTVGSAGLTFKADDAADLARQVRRVFEKPTNVIPERPRVAVVACCWGRELVSGAEMSLRAMALALRAAGCHIEVFTTAGSPTDDGIEVHRYAVDEAPAKRQDLPLPPQPIHSAALVDQLARRAAEFDVILTGPYLAGLTVDVAERWPERVVVVPCFHDEPEVRHPAWPEIYGRVASLLYHSPEEQTLAERVLGINHPRSAVVGTCVDVSAAGNGERGRESAGAEPYLLYCGRYTQEKSLPLLLEYGRRFAQEYPGRVRFACTGAGEGEVTIPQEDWAINLGFVPRARQADLLAGATGLVQLSTRESLSLAALEAWAQGTPVIAHRRCATLAGHIERGAGGLLIDSYEEFAAAVEVLLQPEHRDHLGARGQVYVRQHFGSADALGQRLLATLRDVGRPLADLMRQRGLERAAGFDREQWRQAFGTVIENILHNGPAPLREDLLIQPRPTRCLAARGGSSMLVGVRIVNRGSHAAVALGPGQTLLTACVVDGAGKVVAQQELSRATTLPALLMPGRALSASVLVPLPPAPGEYSIRFVARRLDRPDEPAGPTSSLPLLVSKDLGPSGRDGSLAILDEAQAALVEANRLQKLPDDYTDITQGALAKLKLHIKRKLLGNFKKAYVDVLSRQQSACNQQLVEAVQTLTECCATLDHAVRQLQERVAQLEMAQPPGKTQPAALAQPTEEIEL